MAEFERNIQKKFYISIEEENMIEQKMTLIGVTNFSLYARKMLIDGYIIKRDFREMKELTKELSFIARNLNQIAKRVNETRNIYKRDIEDMQENMRKVKKAVSEQLVKMIDKEV